MKFDPSTSTMTIEHWNDLQFAMGIVGALPIKVVEFAGQLDASPDLGNFLVLVTAGIHLHLSDVTYTANQAVMDAFYQARCNASSDSRSHVFVNGRELVVAQAAVSSASAVSTGCYNNAFVTFRACDVKEYELKPFNDSANQCVFLQPRQLSIKLSNYLIQRGISGNGLYTNCMVPKGTALGHYGGPLVSKTTIDGLDDSQTEYVFYLYVNSSPRSNIRCCIHPDPNIYKSVSYETDFVSLIKGTTAENANYPSLLGFINTAAKEYRNCQYVRAELVPGRRRQYQSQTRLSEVKQCVVCVATRDIQAHEELFASYGDEYDQELNVDSPKHERDAKKLFDARHAFFRK